MAVEREDGNLDLFLQKVISNGIAVKYSFASFIDLRGSFICKKGISKPQTHLRSYKLSILTIFVLGSVIFEAFSSKYQLLE